MITALPPSNSDSPNTQGVRPDLIRHYGDVDGKFLFSLNHYPRVFLFSSTGGDMAFMSACLDFLAAARDIVMVATGQCMSAAVPILCFGVERYATKSTRFLLHPPYVSGASDLNETQLETEKRELLICHRLLLKALAARSKRSLKFWRSFSSYEHYFSAPEAKKLGLIDDVI